MLSLALFASFIASVSAHAYVDQVKLSGVSYPGWRPFEDPYKSPVPSTIVRKVPNDSPITDATSADLACNIGGEDSNGLTVDVAAGSWVEFIWSRWPSDHKGPVTVWLADCQGDCMSFKASSAKWFAIDKKGMNADKTFATDDLINRGASWGITLPSNLAAGEYLIRIELLALHSTGAPQFYPSCSQIRVSGGGDGRPAPGEAVSIQEIYAGYQFPDIWGQLDSFNIAGPQVASFVSGAAPPPPPPPPSSDPETPAEPNPPEVIVPESSAPTTTSFGISGALPTSKPTTLCRRGRRMVKKRAIGDVVRHAHRAAKSRRNHY